MKKIFKFLFSRLLVVGILIVVQVMILTMLLWKLSHSFAYVYGMFVIISLLMVVRVYNKDINPSVKLPWIVLILVIPIFGGLYYLFFGTTKISKKGRRKIEEAKKRVVKEYPKNEDVIEEIKIQSNYIASQVLYGKNVMGMPVYKNTEVNYFPLGENMFESMKEELKKAKKFIFMEYFIIEEGEMWNSILDILKEKVKEGVDIRLIYDDGGCIQTLPNKYYETLNEMGIKTIVFNRLRPALDTTLNNRDHRKITVIDGHTGFTGGINLADEYINKIVRHGHWKDCGVILKGEGVLSLTLMFLEIWGIYNSLEEDYKKYFPKGEFNGEGYVQPFGDTPLDEENVSKSIYLNIINQAIKYVYINTPYLIPDNEIATALTLAAKRGVDVRITTPGTGDSWFVENVARSHYDQLLKGGVRIFEYTPGFIHSKTFLADDEVSVVGTVNLDYRSLYHNHECGVFMYKTKAVMELKNDYEKMLDVCKEVYYEDKYNVPIYIRFIRGILNFFAPLM